MSKRAVVRLGIVALAAVVLSAGIGCAPSSGPPSGEPSETTATSSTPAPAPPPPVVFAIIGDYGAGDTHERAVAQLVASWQPSFILTAGDDYYAPAGGTGTGRYDASTGAFYCQWLRDVAAGPNCAGGASRNAFFPALGNHDYSDATPSPETYLAYFTLPGDGFTSSSGNERYYDFVQGDVHFYVVNSNPDEPDGTSADSTQARWLQDALAGSTSRFDVVCFHHPPFSSDSTHGSTAFMQWPFKEWGAEVVVSGHAHVYERIERDGLTYFVNGLGGATRYDFGKAVPGSALRYRDDWGAQKVTVTQDGMTLEFYNTSGVLIDRASVASPQ